MTAGLSSHVSKHLSATAPADWFGDTACPACAIFGFPIESTRTTNAIHETREHLVKRIEFVMIEKASVGADGLAGLPFGLRYRQDILPIDGGRGNSQTCRSLVQKWDNLGT
jgi:hypothetical protein